MAITNAGFSSAPCGNFLEESWSGDCPEGKRDLFSASPTAELPLVQRGLMGGKVGSPSPARPSPVLMKRTQEEMRGMTARPHITNRNR